MYVVGLQSFGVSESLLGDFVWYQEKSNNNDKAKNNPSLSKVLFSKRSRAQKWLHFSGASFLILKNSGVYNTLVNNPGNPATISKISLDLARTYTTFTETKKTGLFNVLRAYAALYPEIGYCQGMNFIAGVLVNNLSEMEAFWVFVQMMKKYELADSFREGLSGVYTNLGRFERYLNSSMPSLASHLKDQYVSPAMYATKWFLTLFGCRLPLSLMALVFDLFLQFGWSIIYSLSLAILKYFEDTLILLQEEDVLVFLETAPRQVPAKILFRETLRIRETLIALDNSDPIILDDNTISDDSVIHIV
eukprot:TRINITY_DN10810_c0_g1_i1.p1 TRINITY_DN10810_c0_g1~~TRINITY_DN10810_c0_g1_i1.p1  ORF type:complete len:305 (-),score=37.01 TRINITY_DN10810_c0_g1_i1:58-972(-)